MVMITNAMIWAQAYVREHDGCPMREVVPAMAQALDITNDGATKSIRRAIAVGLLSELPKRGTGTVVRLSATRAIVLTATPEQVADLWDAAINAPEVRATIAALRDPDKLAALLESLRSAT